MGFLADRATLVSLVQIRARQDTQVFLGHQDIQVSVGRIRGHPDILVSQDGQDSPVQEPLVRQDSQDDLGILDIQE